MILHLLENFSIITLLPVYIIHSRVGVQFLSPSLLDNTKSFTLVQFSTRMPSGWLHPPFHRSVIQFRAMKVNDQGPSQLGVPQNIVRPEVLV